MITPVSFELAKLLKEKGFNESCPVVVTNENKYHLISGTEHTILNGMVFTTSKNKTLPDYICSAPTIAEVVMWLYEKYGIWISIDFNSENSLFFYCIRKRLYRLRLNTNTEYFNSPAEAYKAAIEYTLNNLI